MTDYHPYTNKVIKEDALTYLKSLDKGVVDLVVTDPPYPISTNNGTNRFTEKGWFEGSQEDYSQEWYDNYLKITEELSRVLKFGRHMYTFVDEKNLFLLKPVLDEWFDFKKIIVWHKDVFGLGYHYRNVIEYILLHSNGESEIKITDKPNFFTTAKPRGLTHPTPKPIDLCRWLVANSTKGLNNTILDPYMGSGTTGIASIKEKQNFLGCDINQEFVDMANKRVDAVLRQTELF